MKKIICIFFLFFNTTIYANSELYESDLYYLEKNEVLLYKILNWWSTKSQENSIEFCFNNLRVRSNKTLNLNYDKQTKILKIYLKEKFADLISVFENKNTYLKTDYINRSYFKNLKSENIKRIDMISLNNISFSEYKKIKSMKKSIAFELEGKVAGLLAYTGKLSFHKAGDFLRTCPNNSNEKFDISFKLLNINTKEILIKYTESSSF
ncbi:hypothetical protein CRV01_10360 [Arcobacter sp. CECT 8983]|uniref:hypothetical protein n=1 Tax=Arcobacter sp. CECT 8983 TaxID=2044508 RepID=UPI00100AE5F2|nr:hypothetical protein [Arcobacter sp. CECT 8983]RXJ89015.1 hypothetical protein CRV01_10360 [Arcobacter sp. CECT 8983]